MSQLPLNGLERLEWSNILWYAYKKNAAYWVIKIEQIPSVPTLSEIFGRGRSAERVILVQQDRTAHLEREYVQLIGVGSGRHLLEDHEGMGVHEMA